MSLTLCNVCPKPGRCCKNFNLHRFIDGKPVMHQFSRDPEVANTEIAAMGYPFVVMGEPRDLDWPGDADPTRADPGRAFWAIECPKVTPDGLCGIYDARPELCVNYVPGVESLCVFHPGCPDWVGYAKRDHLVELTLDDGAEVAAEDELTESEPGAAPASGDKPAGPRFG